MSSSGPQSRSIIKINLTLLAAACLGGMAWLSWPESAENWQMGMFSIYCGFAALVLAYRGFDKIGQFIKNDIAVGRFKKKGRQPQSDRLAEEDAMSRSDMF